MLFDNLDSAINYIEQIVADEFARLDSEILEVMNKEVQEQTRKRIPNMYERTGDMDDICRVRNISRNEIDAVFEDNGRWLNKDGVHAFPLIHFEEGIVWGDGYSEYNRVYLPKTNVEETTRKILDHKLPITLIQNLRNRGINAQ